MNESRRFLRWVPVLAIMALSVSSTLAQGPFTTRTPGDILSQYHDAMVTWETNIFGYARDLFALLATIELDGGEECEQIPRIAEDVGLPGDHGVVILRENIAWSSCRKWPLGECG